MSDLLFLSIAELSERIRRREVSPVELARLALERLETIGPSLGAVVTVARERALAEAREAEREILAGRHRGPLHGVPYGVKDLLATRGLPTTWGAAPYREQVFDFDATVVERLRRAGAVLVGKLAMVELAGGFGYNNADASFTGPTRTPWNRGFWSGGSSSGPGAATAAGLVTFSIGSETSGSILTPAAFSGLSGLRPTYGLVSRHGAMALSWTLDKLGPMCRSADDCGHVLAAIAGPDEADPTTLAQGFAWPPAGRRPPSRWRLGVPLGALDRVQPEVRANFETAIGALTDVADVTWDIELPDFPSVVGTIVRAEGAAAFRELIESGRSRELQNPKDRIGGYAAMATLAVDYLHAMRLRGPMRRAWRAVFAKYDVVVAPTRASVAPPIGEDFDRTPTPPPAEGAPTRPAPALIPAGNAIGAPALALVNGFGQHGLPTSMQLLGAPFSEATLLALGDAYQRATNWHARRPPAPTADGARSEPRAASSSPLGWEERL